MRVDLAAVALALLFGSATAQSFSDLRPIALDSFSPRGVKETCGAPDGFDDGSKIRIEYGWRMGGNSRATEEVRRLIDADLAR